MQLFQAAADEAAVAELPFDPMVYGIAIFAALMFLLLAVMSLRSVAHRREAPASTDVEQPHQGSTSANH